MADRQANNVLIDPSLVLAANSIVNVFSLIRGSDAREDKLRFYYPGSLRRLISHDKPYGKTSAVEFFLRGAYPADISRVSSLLEESSDMLHEFVPSMAHKEVYAPTYKMLSEELAHRGDSTDPDLLDILFEEWVFGQEYSWMVSRIRKPFSRFIESGTIGVQLSKRTVDLLTSRTLRHEHSEFLSMVDRLRAFGKWIAVGGVAAVSRLAISDAVGIAVPTTIGIMLLIDP